MARLNDAPKEALEQVWLFEWADTMARLKWPELSLLFAIPNGGSRHPAEAAHLKGQGVRSGVPDVFLPVPRGGYHGLFVEMKRRKGGVVSGNQKDWIGALNGQGYRAVVCRGFQEAADCIEGYLGQMADGK